MLRKEGCLRMKLLFNQAAAHEVLLRVPHLLPRRALIGLACFGLVTALAGAWWLRQHTLDQLEVARASLSHPSSIPFEKETRSPFTRSEVKLIQSTRAIKALTPFRGSYFAA